MTARVLVTGATGFIGRRTIGRLRAAGFEVHAVARRQRELSAREVRFHEIDLHDASEVSALISQVKPEYLLHLAWDVTPGRYVTSLDNLRWVQTTLGLADAFMRTGGRRLVCAGSSAEYDWRFGLCSEAVTPLKPASLYAACKHGLFEILGRLAEQGRVSFAWGRVFFMYGPDEPTTRLVPSVIRATWRREAIRLRHPNQIRDYLHVDDVGAAFVALLQSHVEGAVNIGSGEPVSLCDLASRVAREAGGEAKFELADADEREACPVVLADVSRLRDEIKWLPGFSLSDGLRDTVEWWTQRRAILEA